MNKKRSIDCDYCDQPAELVLGDVIYPDKPALHFRYYWRCKPCGAYVGTHKNSKDFEPYGRLAKSRLRYLKSRAHDAFDPLWKARIPKKGKNSRIKRPLVKNGRRRMVKVPNQLQSRTIRYTIRLEAYKWLSKKMGIEHSKCHIGMFDEVECQLVINICKEEREQNASKKKPA
jgi:hypothetical protein